MGRNRRTFLAMAAAGAAAAPLKLAARGLEQDMDNPISRDLMAWDAIADHRTGSEGDARTAAWMAAEIRACGLEPDVQLFDFQRRLPGDCYVASGTRQGNGMRRADGVSRVTGVPLFDGGTTDAAGVSGPLGDLGSHAPVGLAFHEPFAGDPGTRALEAARERAGHRAIVTVAAGVSVRPGPALLNADRYGQPFGPPVLQVATGHGPWLRRLAASGATVDVAVPMRREHVRISNVQARIEGSRPQLPPLVVMTPRSAWWTCTAERGGGITVWLEAIRRWAAHPPERTMIFTANTGHELGHVGLKRFLETYPDLLRGAHAWVHLGANFAAADGQVLYQASDGTFLKLGLDAISRAGEPRPLITEPGRRPLGEARDVFDGGGRYVSLLGSNPLFHHPDDRWPHAVDLSRTRRLAHAMLEIIAHLGRG